MKYMNSSFKFAVVEGWIQLCFCFVWLVIAWGRVFESFSEFFFVFIFFNYMLLFWRWV